MSNGRLLQNGNFKFFRHTGNSAMKSSTVAHISIIPAGN